MNVDVRIEVRINKMLGNTPVDIKTIQELAEDSGVAEVITATKESYYTAHPTEWDKDSIGAFVDWAFTLERELDQMEDLGALGYTTVSNLRQPLDIIGEWAEDQGLTMEHISHYEEGNGKVLYWFGTREYVTQAWIGDAQLAMLLKLTYA